MTVDQELKKIMNDALLVIPESHRAKFSQTAQDHFKDVTLYLRDLKETALNSDGPAKFQALNRYKFVLTKLTRLVSLKLLGVSYGNALNDLAQELIKKDPDQ